MVKRWSKVGRADKRLTGSALASAGGCLGQSGLATPACYCKDKAVFSQRITRLYDGGCDWGERDYPQKKPVPEGRDRQDAQGGSNYFFTCESDQTYAATDLTSSSLMLDPPRGGITTPPLDSSFGTPFITWATISS